MTNPYPNQISPTARKPRSRRVRVGDIRSIEHAAILPNNKPTTWKPGSVVIRKPDGTLVDADGAAITPLGNIYASPKTNFTAAGVWVFLFICITQDNQEVQEQVWVRAV